MRQERRRNMSMGSKNYFSISALILKWMVCLMLMLLCLDVSFEYLRFQTVPSVYAEDEEKKEGEAAPEGEAAGPTEIFFNFDPFIVNLRGTGAKRYLKATIVIEIDNPSIKKEIEIRTPQLRDTILFVLTSKSYNDLSSNEGKISLKHELMAHINRILRTGNLRAIYFTEFIIQ